MTTFPSTYNLKDLKFFIVHGIRKYEEREKRLHRILGQEYNLNYFLLTEDYNDVVKDEQIAKYFVGDIRDRMSKGALYCTLVHLHCYERIAKQENEYAVVFENDVCFLGDFEAKMQKIMPEVQALDGAFMVSLENSTLKFPSISSLRKGQYLYPENRGRCAGAYIISKSAARNILEYVTVHKCHEVIDWWHNTLINEGIIKMYWAHPPMIEQGSSNGKLASSLSSNKGTFIRTVKWEIQKFYKYYIRRIFHLFTNN